MSSETSSENKSWTVTLEEDGEDLILPLTDEMIEGLGWQIGDTLEWIDNKDGTWSIRKTIDKK